GRPAHRLRRVDRLLHRAAPALRGPRRRRARGSRSLHASVLNRLIGIEPIEVAKTILLLFVTLIAAIALQQLAATRSTQTVGQADRTQVLGVAATFGQALTTYDYAHPDVQVNQLTPLVDRSVLDRVRRAFPDLALYRAVSVGQPPDVWVQNMDSA